MLLPFNLEQFCLPSRDLKVLSLVCKGVKLGVWPQGENVNIFGL